jgi:hypothetical protein
MCTVGVLRRRTKQGIGDGWINKKYLLKFEDKFKKTFRH